MNKQNKFKYGLAVILGLLSVAATVKISDMTVATSLNNADILPIVQSGANKSSTFLLVKSNILDTATNSFQAQSANLTNWSSRTTNELRTVTNNFSVYVTAGVATNVINMNLASSTNILNGALTMVHATNGIDSFEKTHVRWLWAGGADRAFAIPSTWKTNVYSPVPANITNGTITKMYITTIGDTSSSANQTNVYVSFEYYK